MTKRGPKPKKLIATIWSPNLAYAIGLLATDGYLARNSTLIDLTSKDIEQIKNFNYCVGLNIKIGTKKSGDGTLAYRVQLKNRLFYDFLISIGLTPAKSKTISSLKIPNRYYYDFLRGCFDGDGSFYSYWDKRWKSSFMFYIEFISASPKFINWIRGKNKNLLRVNGHITKDRKGVTNQLKYAKKESITIIRKMYSSPDVVCLSRKRLKIQRTLCTIGMSI